MTALVRGSRNCKRKPILSSQKMLHEDYDYEGSVEKKSIIVSLKGLGTKTN
jgi:hypothetical protein